jgi:hypothetical protein
MTVSPALRDPSRAGWIGAHVEVLNLLTAAKECNWRSKVFSSNYHGISHSAKLPYAAFCKSQGKNITQIASGQLTLRWEPSVTYKALRQSREVRIRRSRRSLGGVLTELSVGVA